MALGRGYRIVADVVLAAAVILAACGRASGEEAPSMGVRPTFASTTLVRNSRADFKIISPDRSEYRALARQILEAIHRKTGADAELLTSTQATDSPFHLRDALHQTNLIVIGNANNNVAHLAMYGNCRTFADSEWPGPGGYELRTVCDPFGTGHNGIVIGASDLTGAKAGTAEFLHRLDGLPDGPLLRLPRWCTVVINGKDQATQKPDLPTFPPADNLQAQVLFEHAMMLYQRTGSTAVLDYLRSCMQWVSRGDIDPNHYWRVALIDPVEVCSNFDLVDGPTLERIDNVLLNGVIKGRDESLVLGARKGNYGNRHQTFGTYGFFRTYRYLLCGNPNPAARAMLEPLLKGSCAYLDSLLSSYRDSDWEDPASFNSGAIFVRYAAGEGHFEWWTSGLGRLAALRALFTRDNLGYFCGSGNSWWAAADLRGSIEERNVIAAAAFFCHDPELASFGYRGGYSWTVQNAHWAPPPDLVPRQPESLLAPTSFRWIDRTGR